MSLSIHSRPFLLLLLFPAMCVRLRSPPWASSAPHLAVLQAQAWHCIEKRGSNRAKKVCFLNSFPFIPSDCFVGMIPSSLAAAVTSSMLLKKMSTVKGAVQSESQCAISITTTDARSTTLREKNLSIKGLCGRWNFRNLNYRKSGCWRLSAN